MSSAILQHALELTWRHWTLVGVRGTAPAPRYPIDIEALIAFTPFVVAADPRLEEESRDWCARVAREFVSLSRLRQMVKLIGQPDDEATAVQLSLFEYAADLHTSGKSRVPDLDHPALLQLRARSLFGVGTRADVVTMLAVQHRTAWSSITASQIRPSGCTKQAVASVLDDLVRGLVLRRVEDPGGIRFELIRGEALRDLLAPVPVDRVDWADRFALVALILRTWWRFGSRPTYGIELMKALAPALRRSRRTPSRPRLVGLPQEIVAEVDRWAVELLDDEAWTETWMVRGEDVSDAIRLRIYDNLVERVQSREYPVGFTELEGLVFRGLDRSAGTASFSVDFDGEHPSEDWSFKGHVEGTLAFDVTARHKEAFLDSVEVTSAEVRFDLDEPD